jgi:hypothetical protein
MGPRSPGAPAGRHETAATPALDAAAGPGTAEGTTGAAGAAAAAGLGRAFLASPRRRWALALAMALGLSGATYGLAIARVHGDVLNSYPVVLMDSFDWLFEGHAVAALLAGNGRIDLPLLRNPVYVLCIAADAALGGSGHLLFALHAAAFLAQTLLLLSAAELLGTDHRLQLAIPALLGMSALGAYRFAVYPDDLALALMLAAVLALLLWRRAGRPAWLAGAGLATVAGALTQEYAALPLVVATLFDSFRGFRRRQPPPWRLLVTCACAGLLVGAAHHAWKAAVPHRYERDPWSLFNNPHNSFGFILGTNLGLWLHAFWPLAGVLAAGVAGLASRRRRAPESTAGTGPGRRPAPSWHREATGLLAAIAAAFALLLLAYRWPDARFAYILTPTVLLLCCALAPSDLVPAPARRPGALRARWRGSWRWLASPWLAAALWIAQGLGVARPFDPWVGPAARVSIPAVLRFPSGDRFSLGERCGSLDHFCPAAGRARPMAAYDAVILCEYRSLKVDGVVGGCGGLDHVANVVPAGR